MLVIGSANMDIVVRAPRAPGPGETVMGLDYALYPGGKGANQAVAARRAGAAVSLCASLGRDSHGAALRAALLRDQVDLSCVSETDDPSGVAFITVEKSGENRIIVIPGANHNFRPEQLPDNIQPNTVMLAQLEVPIEIVLAGAAKVRAAGGWVVLNASPVAGLNDDSCAVLLAAADILLVNETEAAMLLSRADLSSPMEAVQQLARPRRAAVITLGADGVVWATPTACGHVAAHEVSVVDTTACGDAFAGSFAAALEAGDDIEQAVRFGNAAGALAATCPGAQPSLPQRGAIFTFLEQHS